jgi:hypothetical protein
MVGIPDQLPTIDDRRGRCPHCGGASNFDMKDGGPMAVEYDPHGQMGTIQRVGVVRCPGCSKGTVVLEEAVVTQRREPAPGSRDGARTVSVVTGWRGILWWPVAGAADLDQEIPEPVASAFSEGMRALSVNCPRAAAVMFRAMLAAIVRDKGSEGAQQAGGLYKQLKKMAEEQSLHPTMVEWAAEVRLVGDAGAHPENLEPVTPAEAQDLAQLCRQMLSVVYEMPARIRRARSTP